MRRRLWAFLLTMYLGVLPEQSRKKDNKTFRPEGVNEKIDATEAPIPYEQAKVPVTTQGLRSLQEKVGASSTVSMSDTASTDITQLSVQPFCTQASQPQSEPEPESEESLFGRLLGGLRALPDEPQYWWQTMFAAQAAAADVDRLMAKVCRSSLVGGDLMQGMRAYRGVEITPVPAKTVLPRRTSAIVPESPKQPASSAVVRRPSAAVVPVTPHPDDGYVYPYLKFEQPDTTAASRLEAVPPPRSRPDTAAARERAATCSRLMDGVRRARAEVALDSAFDDLGSHSSRVPSPSSKSEAYRGAPRGAVEKVFDDHAQNRRAVLA